MTEKSERAGAPEIEVLLNRGEEIFREWELRYFASECSYANPIDLRDLLVKLFELVLREKITNIEK